MRCFYRTRSGRDVEDGGEVWFGAFGVRKNDSGNADAQSALRGSTRKKIHCHGWSIACRDVDRSLVEGQKLRRAAGCQFFGQRDVESVRGLQTAIAFADFRVARNDTDDA